MKPSQVSAALASAPLVVHQVLTEFATAPAEGFTLAELTDRLPGQPVQHALDRLMKLRLVDGARARPGQPARYRLTDPATVHHAPER